MKQLRNSSLIQNYIRHHTGSRAGMLRACKTTLICCAVSGTREPSLLRFSPRLPSARLTWCTLGKPCLLDDSQLGLGGARLGLQGGRRTFPRQALGGLGTTGVSRQHSSVVRRGRGASVCQREDRALKGQARLRGLVF